MGRTLSLLLAAALCLGAAADARAQAPGALYDDGPGGMYLLDGEWEHRMDGQETWAPVAVPHVWNATDLSEQSMLGAVGWYRREFRLPAGTGAQGWTVRFESANHRATVWLNGREIGSHTGAYLPFELPLRGVRAGVNRLEVRVDSRLGQFDLPPGGPDPETGRPEGGWWNYGGLPREVYLRRIGSADFRDVNVRSQLPCRTCPARVEVVARVRGAAPTGTFGARRLRFAAGGGDTYRATLRIRRPRLWSPQAPDLYRVRLRAGDARYALHHGIKRVKVTRTGRVTLNFQPVALRGASLHEDDPALGNALTPARRRADVRLLSRLGATLTRSHYPLHPHYLELFDRRGILYWDQAPVYQLKEAQLASARMRARAVRYVRRQVIRDRNHASVLAWSLVNELPVRPSADQAALLEAMAAAVRRLDDSRLVAVDILGYPQVGPQTPFDAVDAIGINAYFGWYPGPNASTVDRESLGPYLDQLHASYPRHALFVTEFGAEANRDGPPDEKGTYAFQREFLRYHLGVIAARPFVNGALIWILRDFRVKPGWDGGNPKPDPPVNAKGLVTMDGTEKPAFDEVTRLFTPTTR